jgi:diguanylate cyclase (GGDEF)-like protein/putative nucleotidyltransferase with HDIG domain
MEPPLRQRLATRTSITTGMDGPASRAAMARAGFMFATAGVVLGLLAVVLPHPDSIDEAGLLATAGGAALLALVALLAFDRVPMWAFHVGTAAASVVATAAVYFWGEGSLYGPMPYLWPAFYAFYFFSLRAALAHLALVAALYGGVLIEQTSGIDPLAAWIGTVGTLGSVGVLVALLRDRLASLIANLTDAARRDPVTDLLNRRGFEELFDMELERARRTDRSLSVVVGDIDRFKALNDRFGHGAGDEALRRVAESITKAKRGFDSAARIGGEEFAILAPDADEHGAYILAERARTGVEQQFNAGPGPLTISFGIVSFPVHGQTAEALLQAGDQALYAAKRLGRNRSVISSAEVPGILARGPRASTEGHVELATLLSLAEALDVRDSGSPSHCQRVGRFSELIARELGLPPDSVERVRIAGILHDVGRVGVPDELIDKEGPLSEDDWEWIRSHPAIGARMLETTEFDDIGSWILAHHERPDGSGYPEGLAADAVPLEASILGVADAYEAMTAKRPYRGALDPDAASEELRRNAGQQFDERVVDALLRVV